MEDLLMHLSSITMMLRTQFMVGRSLRDRQGLSGIPEELVLDV